MVRIRTAHFCLFFVLAVSILMVSCATGPSGVYTSKDVEEFEKTCTPLKYDHINFATDKYEIKDFHKPVLQYWIDYLAQCPYVYLEIQGHCDERASYEYNMDLGSRRAFSVQNYLLKAGVKEKQLSVITFGEHMPIKEGHSRSDWKVNRRVEIVPKILEQ